MWSDRIQHCQRSGKLSPAAQYIRFVLNNLTPLTFPDVSINQNIGNNLRRTGLCNPIIGFKACCCGLVMQA